MGQRRFALLAAVLVALNLVLWLVPQGLALRNGMIATLFGPKLIRAEVIDRAPGHLTTDWRIDRGVIVTLAVDQLVVRESDGSVQEITVDSSTDVTFRDRILPVTSLKSGWRVLVVWPAPDGPAESITVEKRNNVTLKGLHSGRLRGAAAFHLS